VPERIAPGRSDDFRVIVTPNGYPVPLEVRLASDNPALTLPDRVAVPPGNSQPLDVSVSTAATASGRAEVTARLRGARASAGIVLEVAPSSGGWQAFADPIVVDAAQPVRIAASIAQISPGNAALVALREGNAIHVNRVAGPPGPGSADARNLEVGGGSNVATTPQIARGLDGSVVVAWHEAGAIRVKRRGNTQTTWTALGGALNGASAAAYHPQVRLDFLSRPIVAWIDSGGVQLRRWDGAAWGNMTSAVPPAVAPLEPLASLRLALDSDGLPLLAWTERNANGDAQARALRWNGSAWVELGVLQASTPAELRIAIAAAADGAALLALAGQGGSLVEVFRHDGSGWVRMGMPFNSEDGAGGPRVWDVALDAGHSGTGFGPAAPMVAWVERGNARASVVRWNGTVWQFVGGRFAHLPTTPEFIGVAAHDVRPAIVVTDFPGGALGRVVTAWRLVP
jgi:hypothetical protein